MLFRSLASAGLLWVLLLGHPAAASSPLQGAREPISFRVDNVQGDPAAQQKLQALRERIRREGETLVLLALPSMENHRYLEGIAPDVRQVAAEISSFKRHMESVPSGNFRIKRELANLPMLSAFLTEPALDAILASRQVWRIAVPRLLKPHLAETTPRVEANLTRAAGYRGAGHAVAILDSGIANSHPFLSQRVIHEWCFGSNVGTGIWSLCPGGAESAGGPGAASACTLSADCDHATHVAGIAAGSAAGVSLKGVAPEAHLVNIKIFSGYCCELVGSVAVQGVLAAENDIIDALDHVYSLRNTHSIAAVNISAGSIEHHTTHCDDELIKAPMDLLRSANIMTVVAAGNENSSGVTFPSCVSTALAVSSSRDDDTISTWSNYGPLTDVIAPGQDVYSSSVNFSANSVMNYVYETKSGTSMAAPHVAGAIAVLRGMHPTWSASTVEYWLKNTGKPITSASNGITRRRLDLQEAGRMPGKPVVSRALLQCAFGAATFDINWNAGDSAPVTSWDVDISTNGTTWADWYNGAGSGKLITLNNTTHYIRARGLNSLGWGELSSVHPVQDPCADAPGGPLPQSSAR